MAKVTSKLQVTLPKAVAKQYGIKPGDEIEFLPAGAQILLSISGKSGQDLSTEERLMIFDSATSRIEQRRRNDGLTMSEARDWTREDLYQRGLSD